MPAIITVNGFLSENLESVDEWKKGIEKKYPNNTWYHLKWESESKQSLITKSVTTNVLTGSFMIGSFMSWRKAIINSEISGILFAEVIENCKTKNFILMGHSLGCGVIFNCLKYLNKNNTTKIKSIHLLGGAIDNNSRKWENVSGVVSENIYNYYSKKDQVLNTLFKAGTLEINPIGRSKININKVINVDVTEKVEGHMKFKQKLHQFIK